jgi:hypothetical protein
MYCMARRDTAESYSVCVEIHTRMVKPNPQCVGIVRYDARAFFVQPLFSEQALGSVYCQRGLGQFNRSSRST